MKDETFRSLKKGDIIHYWLEDREGGCVPYIVTGRGSAMNTRLKIDSPSLPKFLVPISPIGNRNIKYSITDQMRAWYHLAKDCHKKEKITKVRGCDINKWVEVDGKVKLREHIKHKKIKRVRGNRK